VNGLFVPKSFRIISGIKPLNLIFKWQASDEPLIPYFQRICDKGACMLPKKFDWKPGVLYSRRFIRIDLKLPPDREDFKVDHSLK
jgi:hypothetical protein